MTQKDAMIRGVVLLHKIAELAILAVLVIAMAAIPSALFSSVATATPSPSSKSLVVEAFAPMVPSRRKYVSAANPVLLHSAKSTAIPRLDPADLETLKNQGYVVVENFLEETEGLRSDVAVLRQNNKFKIAKIGEASTNRLNQEIRVAETCFLGSDKVELKDVPSFERQRLYDVLEGLRCDLEGLANGGKLDPSLSEFLYAYYPEGGFYRRHRDAIKGSASWLREYSLLLYLNDDSYNPEEDGGQLRLHFDSGGDFLPEGEAPLFQDVDAAGGTLVLFESNKLPHEVLDTYKERFAVVGWYNRPMSLGELGNIQDSNAQAGGGNTLQLAGFAAAAGLVTVGLINLLASS